MMIERCKYEKLNWNKMKTEISKEKRKAGTVVSDICMYRGMYV